MAKPIVPTTDDYSTRLRAWKRAAVEWLGLDPEDVLDLDATEERLSLAFSSVHWKALSRAEPTRGDFERFDMRWTDGQPIIYTGFTHLNYEEGLDLYAAIGPRPQIMSLAEEARLRAALGGRP